MWNEKTLKIIPAVLFLFCILSVFELFLIIEDMNKTEKLEKDLETNLEVLETITELLNEHLEDMNKTEKLEKDLKTNLEVLETITELLNEHLEGMQQQEKPQIKLHKNR